MKVMILSTGNVEEYNDSYALRLLDMGQAVIAEEPKQAAKATVEIVEKLPEAEEPAKETRPTKGSKKK